MSKIVIAALTLSLLLVVLSCVALFAYSVPLWLPIVLLVLSAVLVVLTALKVAKKMRKGKGKGYRATSGGVPLTPKRSAYMITPPRAPLRRGSVEWSEE